MRKFYAFLWAMILSVANLQAWSISQAETLQEPEENPAPNIVRLTTNTGNLYFLWLNAKPVLKYAGSEIIFQSNEEQFTFSKEKVKEVDILYMESIPSRVEEIKSSGVVKYKNQVISATNFQPATPISVYGMDGRLQKREYVGSDGAAIVNLSSLPSGVYVVKVGNDNLKIKK